MPDPKKYSLGMGRTFSEDGKYVAYTIVKGGSDWITIKVRDINADKDLEDEI